MFESETTIIAITGREVLDSRGNPTVEVDVELAAPLVVPATPSSFSASAPASPTCIVVTPAAPIVGGKDEEKEEPPSSKR